MQDSTPLVFLVDDDESYLRAVERLLKARGYRTRKFASARQFLAEHPAEARGCIVTDLDMPDIDGMSLQQGLLQSENPLPIIFLTGKGDIPSSVRAVRRGAEDFITKSAPSSHLIDAIERAIQRDADESKSRRKRDELRQRFANLTPREREVLSHVLRGRLNKQIAADLQINERSVKRHRTALMNKLRARSVSELTRLAYMAGIV